MDRSELVARRVAALQQTVGAFAEGEPHRPLELPLELDLAPAALQMLMSLGATGAEHVAVQSIERFCLDALGVLQRMEMAEPNRYANLLEFGVTQQTLCDRACTHLMHGQGHAGTPAAAGDVVTFMARRNSGQHNPRTIQRAWRGTLTGGSAATSCDESMRAARARPATFRASRSFAAALAAGVLGRGRITNRAMRMRWACDGAMTRSCW